MKMRIQDAGMTENMTEGMVIHVSGAITLADSAELELALVLTETAGVREVTMDLAEVTYVDSVGLGALVRAHDRVTARSGSFRLANMPAPVELAIRQTGLDPVLSSSVPVVVPRQVVRGSGPRLPKQRRG